MFLFVTLGLLNGEPKQEGELEVKFWDNGPFLDAIAALGSHCVTVLDFQEWLAIATNTSTIGKSLDLILILVRVMFKDLWPFSYF